MFNSPVICNYIKGTFDLTNYVNILNIYKNILYYILFF